MFFPDLDNSFTTILHFPISMHLFIKNKRVNTIKRYTISFYLILKVVKNITKMFTNRSKIAHQALILIILIFPRTKILCQERLLW